jgi:FKBP-type peptidyl-prolyl cis-trans isomerase SlyD
MTRPPLERVRKDTVVVFDYALYDSDGEVLEDTEDDGHPARALVGYGRLPAGLERALVGMAPGETCEVVVGPEDGYGEWDPSKEQWFDRSEFPEDVAVEDELEAEGPDGRPVTLRVVEITADAVLADTNHPLAGDTVRFDVIVRSVVAAPAGELEEARKSAPKARLPLAAPPPTRAPAEALRSAHPAGTPARDPLDDEQ